MGKISFNDLDAAVAATSSGEGSNSDIGFFTLKNDGDEAVVRFMCDSVDDFDIQMVHNITLGNKYRKVACLRDPREPIDNCPMCAAGTPLTTRFFIKLISYNKVADPQTGNVMIVPKAMVWERATSYAKTLKSYLDNYGPLSDVICKIIRHGAAGDMKTTYEIVPNLSKQIYRDDIYVKDPSLFGTFETLGSIVMKKDYAEMTAFLTTGSFPEKPKENAANNTQAPAQPAAQAAPNYAAAPAYMPTTSTPMSAAPAYVAPQPQVDPMTHAAPTATPTFDPTRVTPRAGFGGSEQSAQQGFERPRRY
mgnify:FL=1